MPKRTATCQDCGVTFEGSAKGTLSKWCPPCRKAHKTAYDKAWLAANKDRAPEYPSRHYDVYCHRRGSRMRMCCVCEKQFRLSKGEHGDKERFLCEECRHTHGHCTTCKQVLPAEQFNDNMRQTYRGKEPRCRACRKAAYNREDRRVRVAAKYGLTTEQWEAKADAQARCCEVCGRHESAIGKKGLVVDHCHDTGQVRALLCSSCNSGIGLLRDNAALLRVAAEYLDKYQGVKTPATA